MLALSMTRLLINKGTIDEKVFFDRLCRYIQVAQDFFLFLKSLYCNPSLAYKSLEEIFKILNDFLNAQ